MFYTQADNSDLLKIYMRKFAIAVTAIAIMLFAWANLFFDTNISANAATMEGFSNQIEGKVQKDIGTVQRNLGDASGQAKGAVKQVKGKVKQDIGTTQNKLDDAKNTVEDQSENLVDSVKDFFN